MPITQSPALSPSHNLALNESNAPFANASSSDPILLTTSGEMQSPRAKLSKGEIANMNCRSMATMAS